MYKLYIANKNYSSWSLRPWILLRALSIPFEEQLVPFDEGSNWNKFRSFSPNGKVPCLHDGATLVWDSLAIIEYLAERHEGVWPEEADMRAWARCVVSEMHSGFVELRERCRNGMRQRYPNPGVKRATKPKSPQRARCFLTTGANCNKTAIYSN